MSDAQIIAQLSTLFAPYIKKPDELHAIRTRLAQHLESLQPHDAAPTADVEPVAIPPYVTGVRRRYLEALRANQKAQQQYSKLRNELDNQHRTNDVPNRTSDTISTHLKLLKLEREHRQYRTIAHYLSEAEKLAEQNEIYDPVPASEPILNRSTNANTENAALAAAKAQEFTRKLETAVLQANHQLNREQQLLQDIRARQVDHTTPSPEARFHALVATRAELTAWIEESLAKCDVNQSTDELPSEDHTEPAADYTELINRQYEEYLLARKRLLAAASALSQPLPPFPDETTPVPPSKPTTNQPTRSNATAPPPILPALTTHHLPHLTKRQILSQIQTHLTSLLSSHNTTLLSELNRLSDESHLLPSYPILAQTRPTPFSHQRSKSNIDHDTQPNFERDVTEIQIERLLELWRFAIGAAATATEATVNKQVGEGKKATAETMAIVEDMRAHRAMWEKLLDSLH